MSVPKIHLLGADEGDQVTPIGVTQPTQAANLKRIARTGGQVVNRDSLRAGQRQRRPCCRRRSTVSDQTITQFIAHGTSDWTDTNQHLSAVRTAIHPTDLRSAYRLRRRTDGRNRRKPTRIERRHIVITGRLDIVSELRNHLDDHFTLLSLRAVDFLSAIQRISNQHREAVDRRLEIRQRDRRVGIRRIVRHALQY